MVKGVQKIGFIYYQFYQDFKLSFQIMFTAVHGKAVRAHGNHGHNQGFVTDNPLHVNNEIQDLNVHFGTHFCLDLLVVDCKTHVTNGDEQVCGSDDRTYANQ